jgi:hypothetical protein
VALQRALVTANISVLGHGRLPLSSSKTAIELKRLALPA